MSDLLLLITATIHPGSTPFVARSDPEQRRKEYFASFRRLLDSGLNADLLFCENSGADLSEFRELASHYRNSVRILSFSGNAGAEKFGKGYGELEILKYCFATVPEVAQYRYILKISGRYQYCNIVELAKGISEATADVICDLHVNLQYADTKTFAFKPEIALKYLFPFQHEIDDEGRVFIEHLMARCVHRALLDGYKWSLLPATPITEGISATSNHPDRFTQWQQLRLYVIRRLARWIYRN